jgi:hypothetical protein
VQFGFKNNKEQQLLVNVGGETEPTESISYWSNEAIRVNATLDGFFSKTTCRSN